MTGGSTEPEEAQDRECPHCGEYYRDRGISFTMHKSFCDGDGEDSSADSGSESGSTPTDPEPDNPEPEATESDTSVLTEGPAMDESKQTSDDPLSDVDGCPECSAELNDLRETNEYRGHETPADLYCSECGRGWDL